MSENILKQCQKGTKKIMLLFSFDIKKQYQIIIFDESTQKKDVALCSNKELAETIYNSLSR